MSFRLFIYYCALCGGWAAFIGWGFGRLLSPRGGVPEAGIKGMFLGLFVALGLSLVDALWNLSMRNFSQILLRVLVAVVVGTVGGLIGGMIGQVFFGLVKNAFVQNMFLIFGWTLTGLLIGTSIGIFEVLARVVRQEDTSGARRKVMNGLLGGTFGGILGGILYAVLGGAWTALFSNKDRDALFSPSSFGFVALGMCIGLLIGLAQVILKEAWIKIEAGFRAGREMILSKPETTIGRAEACDIGLFGDNAIERMHARILLRNNRYYLADNNTPGGTFVNEQPVSAPVPLQSGDLIRVGRSLLRFGERQKRRRV
jgi:hypothetical protein